MAGIYIHIPFCKQKCSYCDFHFSTSTKYKNRIIDAMIKEIELKKTYLNEPIETIYFGGGTPSFIAAEDINSILQKIEECFELNVKEITLEANPDDLTLKKLKELKTTGINRLSIGIQTFNDEILKWMNRSHNATQAIEAIKNAQQIGFDNISIDLIYAIPSITLTEWENDVQKAIDLNVQHISAYNLTIEEKTLLNHLVETKKTTPVSDEDAANQFDILIQKLTNNGFEHYEISNFGLLGYYSQHNSGYWKQKKYVGIGPSAHAFNGTSRQWNIANNVQYAKLIEEGKTYFEQELLSESDQINEYLLTGLRTEWGCSIQQINTINKSHVDSILRYVEKHPDYITVVSDHLKLTSKGRFYADRIISDLFI